MCNSWMLIPLPKSLLPLPNSLLPLPNRPRQGLPFIRPCFVSARLFSFYAASSSPPLPPASSPSSCFSNSSKFPSWLFLNPGRVLDASSALKEADNWATLSSDVETVFESGDIQAMRSKILGMQQSLEILKDVPDYEDRQTLLESLR